MWEYLYITSVGSCWIDCVLLHEFNEKYQIIYYDCEIKKYIEKLVDLDLIRKKEKKYA